MDLSKRTDEKLATDIRDNITTLNQLLTEAGSRGIEVQMKIRTKIDNGSTAKYGKLLELSDVEMELKRNL